MTPGFGEESYAKTGKKVLRGKKYICLLDTQICGSSELLEI